MAGVKWEDGEIDGVVARTVHKHADSRGWLAEFFRADELPIYLAPAMTYISVTRPGIARGPHAHREQTDMFGFFGPGVFRVWFWDNRDGSRTRGRRMVSTAGENEPRVYVVPPGVVHAYKNISAVDAWVVNAPNKLYAGYHRLGPVDDIRYEDQPGSGFDLD